MSVRTWSKGGRSLGMWEDKLVSALVGVVEEELIAVGIVDYEKPVAPLTVTDCDASGFEFCAEGIECGDGVLVGLGLNVEGDEDESFADLVLPGLGEDEGAALAVDLR